MNDFVGHQVIGYIVFDLADGRVIRTGFAQEKFLMEQAHQGQGVIHADQVYNPNLIVVDLATMTLRDKTEEELKIIHQAIVQNP